MYKHIKSTQLNFESSSANQSPFIKSRPIESRRSAERLGPISPLIKNLPLPPLGFRHERTRRAFRETKKGRRFLITPSRLRTTSPERALLETRRKRAPTPPHHPTLRPLICAIIKSGRGHAPCFARRPIAALDCRN